MYIEMGWMSGFEYINLDDIFGAKNGATICTIEERSDKKILPFFAKLTIIKESPSVLEFSLEYEKSVQPEETQKENDGWGRSTIKVDFQKNNGTAVWKDLRYGDYHGNADPFTVLDVANPKERELVSRIKRERQNALRDLALGLDGECVVSGEKQLEALDAAHIIGVRDSGDDAHGNIILLRADLHRLQERGLLKFSIQNDGCVVDFSRPVSAEYEKFRSKKIRNETYIRIKSALSKLQ